MKALLVLLLLGALAGCAPRMDGCEYLTFTATQAADALEVMEWGMWAVGDAQWAKVDADLTEIEARFQAQRAPRGTAAVALAMDDYLASERRWVAALQADEAWEDRSDEALYAAVALERAVRLARIELGCPRGGQ